MCPLFHCSMTAASSSYLSSPELWQIADGQVQTNIRSDILLRPEPVVILPSHSLVDICLRVAPTAGQIRATEWFHIRVLQDRRLHNIKKNKQSSRLCTRYLPIRACDWCSNVSCWKRFTWLRSWRLASKKAHMNEHTWWNVMQCSAITSN